MTNTRVILECRHELWFKTNVPEFGDLLYCKPCDTYRTVGDGQVNRGPVYHPDYDWRSTPGYPMTGECLVPRCGVILRDSRFASLRDRMEKHHITVHASSSLTSDGTMKRVPIPAKGAKPTF